MQNNKMKFRSALLVSAATVAAIGLASVSMNAADDQLETVVVTGSRIPSPNLYSSTPVTSVGQDEIKYQGTTSVETMLNSLPSAFATQTSEVANGATGTSSADLRGLGSSRTLVLIDGKRLMPGAPDSEVPDLNFIPSALVERMEVVTGGASTVYGSDAVAGVVNFIMRKDFEGVEFDVQGGISQHNNGNKMMQGILADSGYTAPHGSVWDGENASLTALFGANTKDGRGNVTMYFGYRTQRAVTQNKRDFSSCLAAVNYNTMNSYYCGGSGTTANTRFYNQDSDAYASGAVVTATGIKALTSSDLYNTSPTNYLQRPDTRYQAGAFGHYQVNKHLELYGSFMFMDDHTVAQIAPSGIFWNTYDVNCDNPYLAANSALQSYVCGSNAGSDTDASVYIGRRFTEAGARQDDLRHTDYRIVLGAKGEIIDGITYELSAQYATAIYAENYRNDVSISRVQKALQSTDEGNGPVCKSVTDGTDTSCVAIDVFSTNGLTSDMLDYVMADGLKKGSTEERIVNFNVTADLGKWGVQSPWASSGVFINVGYEYRGESLTYLTDEEYQNGDLAGQGGNNPSVSGFYNVSEGFIEGRLPLVSNMPLVQDFTVTLGYRYASYNMQGNADSFKYGFEWQTVDDLRIRGSYQRAVRAPNINEMFSPTYQNLWNGTDPCAGTNPTYSLAQCERTGLTSAQYGKVLQCSASQCGAVYGGNTALKPESADTWSIGFVFTPTFINGLTATVDYYNIKVKHLIGTVSPSIIISQCAATGDDKYCDLIHRNSSNGNIFSTGDDAGYVSSTNLNTGYLQAEGMDFSASYQFDLEQVGLSNAGAISTTFTGTYQWNYDTQPYDGGDSYNCAGYFGLTCGTPNPKWRHNMRVTWESPWDFNLSLAWRYFGKVSFDGNSANAMLNDGYAFDYADASIPDYSYFDLAGDWTVSKGVTLRFGIENIFDRDPPIVDSGNLGISGAPYGNGNTFPGVYDALGRTMFIGATIKL